MPRTEKLQNEIKTMDMVSFKEKPKKGAVFTEWDILFEEKLSARKRDQIIERLLNKVLKYKVKDDTITTALKYQMFKSETNEHLYILRVYRSFKKRVTDKKNASKSVAPIASDLQSGPIRTPGPPVPKLPAGVVLLSNTVDLSEDLSV